MSQPPKVPMDKPPADSLLFAKQMVVATIAGATGTTPPSIKSKTPIKALPDDAGAKVVARVKAGLAPLGTDSPRSAMFTRVVLPSAALAVLDAVLFIVALVTGSNVLAVVAAVLLVVFGSAAYGGQRAVAADPLRLTTRDRLAVANAGRWSSQQHWSGPIASTRECALIVAAGRAGQRIVASPTWTSGQLADSGVQLSLGAELDTVDAAAFTIASQRYRDFPGGLPGQPVESAELDATWGKIVTRVAALTAYADTLDGMAAQYATAFTAEHSIQDGQFFGPLPPGTVESLAFFLSSSIYDAH